jgi:hypothetical protein
MTLAKRRVSAVSILVALVLLLVPALAWMQYQWLGQLSEAERERMQRTLRTAATQFANEFDTELSRTLISLQVDGATVRDSNWAAYAQRHSAWVSSVTEPRLVKDVWVVDTVPGTSLPPLGTDIKVPIESLRLRRWNAQSRAFEMAEWREDLASLREPLASRFIGFQVQRARNGDASVHRESSMSFALGDETMMVSPITHFEFSTDDARPPRIAILGFTVVQLDPSVIRTTMLAQLAARHFNSTDHDAYRVAVLRKDDPTKVIWESEPGAAGVITAKPDVSQQFMGPRPDQMFIFARGIRGELPPPPPTPLPPTAEEGRTGRPRSRQPHHHARRPDGPRGPLDPARTASHRFARIRGGRGALAKPDDLIGGVDAADPRRRLDRGLGQARASAGAAADGIRRRGLSRAAHAGVGDRRGGRQPCRRRCRRPATRPQVRRNDPG